MSKRRYRGASRRPEVLALTIVLVCAGVAFGLVAYRDGQAPIIPDQATTSGVHGTSGKSHHAGTTTSTTNSLSQDPVLVPPPISTSTSTPTSVA
jgi:hypothetical protein